MLHAIWQHRGFVKTLALSEFREQSARALWGYGWLVVEPAIQIAIYVLLFSAVLRARLPGESDPLAYSLFVCSGLLAWNFFSALLLGGRTIFLENSDLLRTIQFPRSTLPAALLLRCIIRAAIPVAIFLVVVLSVGRWPGALLLAAIPFLCIQALLGISLAVLFGTLNVFVRDVGLCVGVALQFLFWLTPIVYPLEIVPEWAAGFIQWNPMYHIVSAYQNIIVFGNTPDWLAAFYLSVLSLIVTALAWVTFRTLSPDIVDEL